MDLAQVERHLRDVEAECRDAGHLDTGSSTYDRACCAYIEGMATAIAIMMAPSV